MLLDSRKIITFESLENSNRFEII